MKKTRQFQVLFNINVIKCNRFLRQNELHILNNNHNRDEHRHTCNMIIDIYAIR